MKNFILEPGGKIVFGGGCVREYLASLARSYGPNVLLVSGVSSGQRNGACDEALRSLRDAGKHVIPLSGVRPGPDYETVRRGAQLAREQRVDLILGVGGGSVIDCCKAVSLAAVCRGDLWNDFWERQGVVDFQPLPVGVVSTTLGTGELNGAVVLTRGTAVPGGPGTIPSAPLGLSFWTPPIPGPCPGSRLSPTDSASSAGRWSCTWRRPRRPALQTACWRR